MGITEMNLLGQLAWHCLNWRQPSCGAAINHILPHLTFSLPSLLCGIRSVFTTIPFPHSWSSVGPHCQLGK